MGLGMADGFEIVEIVFLAMLAGFIGLRLFSVLGRRTGEERKPVTDIYGEPQAEGAGVSPRTSPADAAPAREIEVPVGASPALGAALRQIAKADPAFSPAHFVEGAQAAYRIVLESFWASDLDGLKPLVSDDVFDNFERAVVHRKAEGHSLDNRILSIDRAEITEAELDGAMAEVTVRFVTQLIAVTRDESGAIVHGAADETLEVHDVWTFSRHTRSEDPSWLLIATDSD
jgi:predicted lipid-binding transport protein (Tim44 family)